MSEQHPTLALARIVQTLEPGKAAAVKEAFGSMFDRVEAWSQEAKPIQVNSIDESYKMRRARILRLEIRSARVELDKRRKAMKAGILLEGRAIDGAYAIFESLVDPIESHLLEQEQFGERWEAEQTRLAESARLAEAERVAAAEAQAARVAQLEREAAAAREREETERLAKLHREKEDLERSQRETAQRAENERLRAEAIAREEAHAKEQAELRARADFEQAGKDAAEAARREAERIAREQVERREKAEADLAVAQEAAQEAVTGAPAEGSYRGPVSFQLGERSLPNGSASANQRTIACPSWLALPSRVNRSTKYNDRGHNAHGFTRAIIAGVAKDDALAEVSDPALRETCRMLDWDKLCGDLDDLETEVAYAIDVKARTARLIGTNIGRDYHGAARRLGQPLGPNELPGSLDITGRRKTDRRRVVTDTKFGYQDVEEIESNAQALFFAAVFVLMDGEAEVECRMAKIKPSGDVWNDVAVFTAWDVDCYLDALEDALDRANQAKRLVLVGGVPDFHAGDHCTYCPGADSCPSKTNLARAMLGDLQALDGAIEVMSDQQARGAYEKAHDQIKPVLDRILEGLKERARRSPIPLAEGLELREAPYSKQQPDFAAAVTLARSLGATEAQIKEECFKSTIVRPVKACKVRR